MPNQGKYSTKNEASESVYLNLDAKTLNKISRQNQPIHKEITPHQVGFIPTMQVQHSKISSVIYQHQFWLKMNKSYNHIN